MHDWIDLAFCEWSGLVGMEQPPCQLALGRPTTLKQVLAPRCGNALWAHQRYEAIAQCLCELQAKAARGNDAWEDPHTMRLRRLLLKHTSAVGVWDAWPPGQVLCGWVTTMGDVAWTPDLASLLGYFRLVAAAGAAALQRQERITAKEDFGQVLNDANDGGAGLPHAWNKPQQQSPSGIYACRHSKHQSPS